MRSFPRKRRRPRTEPGFLIHSKHVGAFPTIRNRLRASRPLSFSQVAEFLIHVTKRGPDYLALLNPSIHIWLLDLGQKWQSFARGDHHTGWLLDCHGEDKGVLNKQLRVDRFLFFEVPSDDCRLLDVYERRQPWGSRLEHSHFTDAKGRASVEFDDDLSAVEIGRP